MRVGDKGRQPLLALDVNDARQEGSVRKKSLKPWADSSSPQKLSASPARRRHALVSRHTSACHVNPTHNTSKPFQSTYYDEKMRASPALLRARAPYLIKNTITGFCICSLVIGICMPPAGMYLDWSLTTPDAYTINVISQDDFGDVVVPDEPLKRPAQQPGTTQSVQQAVAARKQ
jgi:cytochrome c oxidase assembly factor 3